MREVLTVQIGGYANFVGSHFWNFQDELLGIEGQSHQEQASSNNEQNMDVLYRSGETQKGTPTYTPRLVAFDSRGSAGSVRSSGSLYGKPTAADSAALSSWHGPVVTYTTEPYERNKFLQCLDEEEEQWVKDANGNSIESSAENNQTVSHRIQGERALVQSLEDGVQFWTDYLKVHFHPLSLYELPGVWHGSSLFDNYGTGTGVVSGDEESENIRDKVRFFVEECDHLQGFQVLVDDSGGFSAVAADILEDIVEEYGRNPMLVFTVRPPFDVDHTTHIEDSLTQALHDSVSLAKIASTSHLCVPMGLPHLAENAFAKHLVIQDRKMFHTSAVYATAINCATLPFRMKACSPSGTSEVEGIGNATVDHVVQLVSCNSARRVASMEASLPAPALPDIGSDATFDLQKLSFLTPSTGHRIAEDRFGDLLVVQSARYRSGKSARVSDIHEIMKLSMSYLKRDLFWSQVSISPCPLAVPVPFPCIFSQYISRSGDILGVGAGLGRGGLDVVSVPVVARVSTSAAALPYIKKRLLDICNLGTSRSSMGVSLLDNWGFAREEVQELQEVLSNMVDTYGEQSDNYSSDSE